MGRPRRVAIAVKTWSGEECVFVWNWAKKYFIQVGERYELLSLPLCKFPATVRCRLT